MEKQLLSTEEAANYIGIKAQTLRLWRSKGLFNVPTVKIGERLVKYDRADLDQYIEEQKATA